ncbi:uncharacterized protein LOC118143655 [Callithrix jacchus]
MNPTLKGIPSFQLRQEESHLSLGLGGKARSGCSLDEGYRGPRPNLAGCQRSASRASGVRTHLGPESGGAAGRRLSSPPGADGLRGPGMLRLPALRPGGAGRQAFKQELN